MRAQSIQRDVPKTGAAADYRPGILVMPVREWEL
jgi:hypothetical protein